MIELFHNTQACSLSTLLSISKHHGTGVWQNVVNSFSQILWYRSCKINDKMTWFWSQGSAVSIVTRLWAGWFEAQFPVEAKSFFSSPKCPDHLCAPYGFVFGGYWSSFPGIKQLGHEADHLLSSSSKIEWSSKSTSPFAFMAYTGTITYLSRILWLP